MSLEAFPHDLNRSCCTQAISNFLRQDAGSVRLERDCNECAAGAARQQAQQQLHLGAWQAAAQQPELPNGLRHNSGAALLAQLSSVLQNHMVQQHHQHQQQQQQRRHPQQQQHPQVGQWQPPPLPMTSSALAAHLGPRSPLILEPQRVLPQTAGMARQMSAGLMPQMPAPQHIRPGSLSLSRVSSLLGDALFLCHQHAS